MHWIRIVGALVPTLIYYANRTAIDDERLRAIAESFATIAGTLTGFLITAVALLTAVMDRTLIANMRKTGHYDVLVTDTFATTILLLIVTVASLVCLFLSGQYLQVGMTINVWLASIGLFYSIQAGRRFAVVIAALR